MFLTTTDYNIQIQTEIKNIITSDASTWTQAELQAEEEITGYLRNRYDVANIFNKTGAARNQRIVMLMVDIVLYHIHSRIAPRNIPQIREDRYDHCIEWLKSVNKGSIMPELPTLTNASEEEVTGIRTGSNPKLSHNY